MNLHFFKLSKAWIFTLLLELISSTFYVILSHTSLLLINGARISATNIKFPDNYNLQSWKDDNDSLLDSKEKPPWHSYIYWSKHDLNTTNNDITIRLRYNATGSPRPYGFMIGLVKNSSIAMYSTPANERIYGLLTSDSYQGIATAIERTLVRNLFSTSPRKCVPGWSCSFGSGDDYSRALYGKNVEIEMILKNERYSSQMKSPGNFLALVKPRWVRGLDTGSPYVVAFGVSSSNGIADPISVVDLSIIVAPSIGHLDFKFPDDFNYISWPNNDSSISAQIAGNQTWSSYVYWSKNELQASDDITVRLHYNASPALKRYGFFFGLVKKTSIATDEETPPGLRLYGILTAETFQGIGAVVEPCTGKDLIRTIHALKPQSCIVSQACNIKSEILPEWIYGNNTAIEIMFRNDGIYTFRFVALNGSSHEHSYGQNGAVFYETFPWVVVFGVSSSDGVKEPTLIDLEVFLDRVVSTTTNPSLQEPTEDSIISVSVILGVLSIVAITAVPLVIYCRKRRQKRQHNSEQSNPLMMTNDSVNLKIIRVFRQPSGNIRSAQISWKKVVVSPYELGNGAFGVVKRGSVALSKTNIQQVAVKLLDIKQSDSQMAAEEKMVTLISEIELMIKIRRKCGVHDHLVQMVGFTWGGTSDCMTILTEYCRFGSLIDFLNNLKIKIVSLDQKEVELLLFPDTESPEFYQYLYILSESLVVGDKLSIADSGYSEQECATQIRWPPLIRLLLIYAKQVCLGMEHLAKNRFVHRDLAARNVLVHSLNVVKIGDFGLTRDVADEDDYRYVKSTPERLPVRWMAPETLLNRSFSQASDVWSFGVVLWELFSLASKPYGDIIDNDVVVSKLLSGYRLERPVITGDRLMENQCPDSIYSMMLKCWEFEDTRRPTFANLVAELSQML